jgi:hypothetical protein
MLINNMEGQERLKHLLEIKNANKKVVENYIKLFKAVEILEDSIIKKTKVMQDFMHFVDSIYKNSINNYHIISQNFIK